MAAVNSPLLADALSGRYTIERELGRGGMATVYLARDLRHHRPVALKVLHPEMAYAIGADRFLREIEVAANLIHPHILPLHDSGEAAGLLYYVMPYVEGESLRDLLQRETQLPVDQALQIAREVADASAYAHGQGVIHRDIKPENILLSCGHALVADFGFARAIGQAGGERLSESGMALGTPAYMSPEQASGVSQIDGRSDVYSLGCVLYEMLAGEPPYTGPTAQAVIAKRFIDPVPQLRRVRPSVPESVEQAVTRALAPVAADRFAGAAEFARALQPTGATPAATTATAPPPSAAARSLSDAPVSISRRRMRVAATAVGLALLLGLGLLFAWSRKDPGGPSGSAEAKRVAVLPFENLGRPEDEYFADGVTDAVRGKLAAIPGLQVTARSSSSQYKHTAKSPQAIGQELGVQYLLTGTVRWGTGAGGQDRVQVSPELVQVATASTRWQAPFDAALTDVFQVQADIAGRVAEALNLTLGAAQRQTLAAKPTASLPAYDAYLKGEAAAAQFTRIDGPSLQRAIDLYERAVALDSRFVDAWTQLARAHALYYWWVLPNPTAASAARQAASRAEALAPGSAAAALARGSYLALVERDAAQALATFRTGLQAEPRNVELLVGLATQEREVGHLDSALALLRTAALLDPRSLTVVQNQVQTLLFLRRYPEALAANDRALALSPQDLQSISRASIIHLQQGDLAGAQAVVRAAASKAEPIDLVTYLALYSEVWALDSAQQDLLLRLRPNQAAFGNDRGWWGLVLTRIYYLRGDRTKARIYADSARQGYEEQLLAAPQDGVRHSLLGLSLAFMGRRMEAIREGHRATALEPLPGRVVEGPYVRHAFAEIYLLLGEPEKALDYLEPLLKVPYWLSPGWLKIDPTFTPLRGNPRFQRLVAAR